MNWGYLMPDKDRTPGPDPDRLKLDEDDWKEAAKKALKKERPEGGWPKPDQGNQNGPED